MLLFGDIACSTIKMIGLMHQAYQMYYVFFQICICHNPISSNWWEMLWCECLNQMHSMQRIFRLVQAYITLEQSHSELLKKIANALLIYLT